MEHPKKDRFGSAAGSNLAKLLRAIPSRTRPAKLSRSEQLIPNQLAEGCALVAGEAGLDQPRLVRPAPSRPSKAQTAQLTHQCTAEIQVLLGAAPLANEYGHPRAVAERLMPVSGATVGIDMRGVDDVRLLNRDASQIEGP